MSELVTLGGVRLGSDPGFNDEAEKSLLRRLSGDALDSRGPAWRRLVTQTVVILVKFDSPGHVKGACRGPIPMAGSNGMATALMMEAVVRYVKLEKQTEEFWL